MICQRDACDIVVATQVKKQNVASSPETPTDALSVFWSLPPPPKAATLLNVRGALKCGFACFWTSCFLALCCYRMLFVFLHTVWGLIFTAVYFLLYASTPVCLLVDIRAAFQFGPVTKNANVLYPYLDAHVHMCLSFIDIKIETESFQS